AGLGEDFAGSAGDKALAPELDAVAGKFLVTDAIGHGDVATIGDGVRALNRLPCSMLLPAMFGFLARMPADGGGVKENLGALHGRETGRFRIPLVPADEDADSAIAGLPGAK